MEGFRSLCSSSGVIPTRVLLPLLLGCWSEAIDTEANFWSDTRKTQIREQLDQMQNFSRIISFTLSSKKFIQKRVCKLGYEGEWNSQLFKLRLYRQHLYASLHEVNFWPPPCSVSRTSFSAKICRMMQFQQGNASRVALFLSFLWLMETIAVVVMTSVAMTHGHSLLQFLANAVFSIFIQYLLAVDDPARFLILYSPCDHHTVGFSTRDWVNFHHFSSWCGKATLKIPSSVWYTIQH